MVDVVYLHVGAPKTGTTYLQDRLYANRARLAENGISYPVGVHVDMFRAAADLTNRRWAGLDTSGEWDRLVTRGRRSPATAVVSHEILSGATRHQVARVMADFADAEVHVVYSARDIGRQLPAEWPGGLEKPPRRLFKSHPRRPKTEPPPAPPHWVLR